MRIRPGLRNPEPVNRSPCCSNCLLDARKYLWTSLDFATSARASRAGLKDAFMGDHSERNVQEMARCNATDRYNLRPSIRDLSDTIFRIS